ncbi:MAG: hypothetical protein ACLFTT_15540 [Candidatus Hydrogenedentota bacterium]
MANSHESHEQTVSKMSKPRKLLYSMVPVLALLLLIEGGARLVELRLPERPIDLGRGFHPDTRHFMEAPDSGRLQRPNASGGDTTFAAEKPAKTYRIFALGGSSVAFLQEHLKRLEASLSEEYAGRFDRVEVINAGFWSYGSQRVLIVAREVLEYDPDLILLYTGHNEFEDLKQLEVYRMGPPPLLEALSHSAVFHLYWHHMRARKISVLESERNRDILRRGPFPSPEEWEQAITPAVLEDRMDAFENNLRLIADMCRQRGVPLIIGTVPSNHWEPSLADDGGFIFKQRLLPLREARKCEVFHRRVRELVAKSLRRQSSDVENRIIRRVAEDCVLPVADVRQAVRAAEPHGIPGETLFDDPCHLNTAGNDLWIQTYRPLIHNHIRAVLARRAASGETG